MQHLVIAYELGVIMIGFVTLFIAGFWAFRTGESYLRDFCIVYSLFTMMMVVETLKKYLSLNVADYSDLVWYTISGFYQVMSFATVVATLHFFLGVFQVRFRKMILLVSLARMLLSVLMMFSPYGAVLGPKKTLSILAWAIELLLFGFSLLSR